MQSDIESSITRILHC